MVRKGLVTHYVHWHGTGRAHRISVLLRALGDGASVQPAVVGDNRMRDVEASTLWLIETEEADRKHEEAYQGKELEGGLPAEEVDHIDIVDLDGLSELHAEGVKRIRHRALLR